MAEVLKRAISKSRLTYKNAPVVANQPVGMIVLRRPDGSIHIFPHLFDVQPWEVRWEKD